MEEHLLAEHPAFHYDYPEPLSAWSAYHEQSIHHTGELSYALSHHVPVDVDQSGSSNSYQQHLQYLNHHPAYEIPQNDTSQTACLVPSDPSIPCWPATGSVPTTLPVHAAYNPPSSYTEQDLSSMENYHAVVVDHSQSGPPPTCATSYDTPDLIYPGSATALVAPSAMRSTPALASCPSIAQNQGEGGHDLTQTEQNAITRYAVYEGPTSVQTDASYGLYGTTYVTTEELQSHYGQPFPEQEEQRVYIIPSVPQAQGLAQYETPTSARSRSPMDHLPYPEDVAKVEAKSRQSSVLSSATGLSPSPSLTPPPPPPQSQSPALQTFTFITYPDTEPKVHDEHGTDEDGSPSRRGRRGKKQPKKDPFLACFFCRGRKIACQPKGGYGEDRTCGQCAKRRLICEYPVTSRRGQRKPLTAELDSVLGHSGRTGGSAHPATKPRARASSKLSTTSLT